MVMHLTVRVAWHDRRWNGTVCRGPSRNPFCVTLDRIREERDEEAEEKIAGRPWSELEPDSLPPCKAESGAFMNPQEWVRVYKHPYQSLEKAAETHGHLRPTSIKVPEYSTFVVPFWWMLAESQKTIDASLPEPLPPDEKAPFKTPWVFGRARQEAISRLFFDRARAQESLAFFYTKEGSPFGDEISRLVVGVGTVTKISDMHVYESSKNSTYPMWDRLVRHSIRPEGNEGFLLPYHDYLEPTGDLEEDVRRQALAREIVVAVPPEYVGTFSFTGELAGHDASLAVLVRCLAAVRKIREHGIAKGPWERREEWLNTKIAAVWKDRGPFPGLGSSLEALGMRLGTSLVQELAATGALKPNENPWKVVDAVIRGKKKPPQKAYVSDLAAIQTTWTGLDAERRKLIELLSRFDLTSGQAKRWFESDARAKATAVSVSDSEILANPYRMCEADLGDWDDAPISTGVIDRGLLPEATVRASFPIPEPSAVEAQLDGRRVRAAIVASLRAAAAEGDALLSVEEAVSGLSSLDLAQPCLPGRDWVEANAKSLEPVVELLSVPIAPESAKTIQAFQLTELKGREERLRKILRSRAEKTLDSLGVDWKKLLREAIEKGGGKFDPKSPRHVSALEEQAVALEKITTRKLSVLVGRAGTGKTSVLGALLGCEALVKGGVLLLAPTGKARVKLGKATSAEAMTVAQFLHRLERYEGARQRPLFKGEKHRKEKTVVIDECSMLTLDDLVAVLEALDLAHVQRVILVGDPNQLPPIGVGRPFADLIGSLEEAVREATSELAAFAAALARLTVECRSAEGGPSDTLRLASWFTRDPQPIDADRVWSDLERGTSLNDLEVVFWQTPEDLRARLLEQFKKHLGIKGPNDADGFNRALGFNDKGWVPFDAPEGAENFQILSPVRMHPHGVHEMNRWIQRTFRGKELKQGREPWGLALGDEEIVVKDKVIQVRNEWRQGWDGTNKDKHYLANGEIGTAALKAKSAPIMNVAFAGRPGLTFGYMPWDFPGGTGPLELAYALTVHKSQGSEFKDVFVVLPKNCRLLARELLYTALTRSRRRLVLLVEGKDASGLYEFTKPESSNTARRNTNVFRSALRERKADVPYAEHLIHRTEKGHMVRSKSELVIANMIFRLGLEYEYERLLVGEKAIGSVRPDFSFADPAGELVVWEHLGMLDKDDYRKSWDWKKNWYEKNGYALGKNLFTTEEDGRGGLDSLAVKRLAEKIRTIIS